MSGIIQGVLASIGGEAPPTTFGQAYGGGFYAGKIVEGGNTYYVIVSPKSSGESSSKQWRTSIGTAPTQTQTLNNGFSASSSMDSSTYPAAQFCEGLSIGGYTDWYLPSRDEFELCFRNLKPVNDVNNTGSRDKSSITYPEGNDVSGDTAGINRNSDPNGSAYTTNSPGQTSSTAFKDGGAQAIYAFASYWTSSAFSTNGSAWIQDTYYGGQFPSIVTNSGYVRAVRRVKV